MIVVVILGVLATMIVPKLMGRPDEARIMAAKQDIATLMQSLKLYKLDNGRYPTTEQGLSALVRQPTLAPVPANWAAGGYLEKLPLDPWGKPYLYLFPAQHGGDFDLMSYGADNAAGGEGADSDIGSWML